MKRYLRNVAKQERLMRQAQKRIDEAKPADYLPENNELDAAIRQYLCSQRDSRAQLSMLQLVLNGTFLSCASPVGLWDPLNIKPQIFALDQYFALPIFTSQRHLQSFCSQFQLSVREPRGQVWGDWREDPTALLTPLRDEDVRSRSFTPPRPDNQQSPHSRREDTEVEKLHRLGFSKATPLPTFGPFVRPFLYGYFAELELLLHNINIISEKVDIVVNPGTGYEFVISRDISNAIIQKENVMLPVYKAVEFDLQREFTQFFRECCPEVVSAKSITLPRTKNDDGRTPSIAAELECDIVVMVQSADFDFTISKCSEAKSTGQLIGHSSLQFFRHDTAPEHYQEGGMLFYDGSHMQRSTFLQQPQQQPDLGFKPHRWWRRDVDSAPQGSSPWGPSGPGNLPKSPVAQEYDRGLAMSQKAGFSNGWRRMGSRGSAEVVLATDVSPSSYFSDKELRGAESHLMNPFKKN